MATGFVYHPDFLQHDTGPLHPEAPERLVSIMNRLQTADMLESLVRLEATPVDLQWVEAVHTARHLDLVQRACHPDVPLHLDDLDTVVCPASFAVARLAAGGVLNACDAVVSGKVANAFCAVRPPGHHAESDRVMGFCLLNHVAIAARYLQRRHHLRRILIVDWDVHHGNGTQQIFYEDSSVFYFSIHQYPHYPGTGAARQRGAAEGLGTTLNAPMPAGSGDREYIEVFESRLLPTAREFMPEFVLISAGFDAHQQDPLSGIDLSDRGFTRLTELVVDLAEECCEGRLVSVLEGGYHLGALARCVARHVEALQQA